ncbi:MAG: HDIG domain-containing protein, partial [Thermoanaerobaculia bacterium]
MTREDAWKLVHEHVQADGLRRHMLAVEAAMRSYAARLGEDPEPWGLAGLLHDWDWEIHPTLESHPKDGVPRLRELGCPEAVVQAILAHNEAGTGVAAASNLDFGLRACDEITGLVIAAALVRPTRDARDVEVRSIQKRWKEKAFAAGVDRAEVERATADFSRVAFGGALTLPDHIGQVLGAMQGAAAALGLDGRL